MIFLSRNVSWMPFSRSEPFFQLTDCSHGYVNAVSGWMMLDNTLLKLPSTPLCWPDSKVSSDLKVFLDYFLWDSYIIYPNLLIKHVLVCVWKWSVNCHMHQRCICLQVMIYTTAYAHSYTSKYICIDIQIHRYILQMYIYYLTRLDLYWQRRSWY